MLLLGKLPLSFRPIVEKYVLNSSAMFLSPVTSTCSVLILFIVVEFDLLLRSSLIVFHPSLQFLEFSNLCLKYSALVF